MSLYQQLLILCPMVFFAAFIDAVAGGGGLISLPAYLLTGIPIHMAYGTNKLSSTISTFAATIRYALGNKIHYKCAVYAVVTALGMSYLGARATLLFDDRTLRIILMVMLPIIAVLTLLKKRLRDEDNFDHWKPSALVGMSLAIGAVIGFYDGFFGPGTGMFLMLGFSMLGFSAVKATGNAKVINLASSLAALVSFLRSGNVIFTLGLPAAAFGIIGGYLGAHLAVKIGAQFIRPVFVCVVILLVGTILHNMVF